MGPTRVLEARCFPLGEKEKIRLTGFVHLSGILELSEHMVACRNLEENVQAAGLGYVSQETMQYSRKSTPASCPSISYIGRA